LSIDGPAVALRALQQRNVAWSAARARRFAQPARRRIPRHTMAMRRSGSANPAR
jgi:hypothetical protein